MAQVAHRVLEVLHQRVEVRVLTGQRAQVAHEAREDPGQRRTERAGTAQVVAEAELVDEAGEQVEVAIRKLVAGQLVECCVCRFEERHERALAGEVLRARLLERLAALHGVVDDVRQGLDRRRWLFSAGASSRYSSQKMSSGTPRSLSWSISGSQISRHVSDHTPMNSPRMATALLGRRGAGGRRRARRVQPMACEVTSSSASTAATALGEFAAEERSGGTERKSAKLRRC